MAGTSAACAGGMVPASEILGDATAVSVVTSHKFRHSFCTISVLAGVNFFTLRR